MENSKHDDFRELMQRVASGSEEAAEVVLKSYGAHVLMAVRRRLDRKLRSQIDSGDFVQAVWASFFANRNDLARFREPRELIGHLAIVARNKVVEEFRRRLQTQKRNISRELSLNDSSIPPSLQPKARTPTPSQIAMTNEQWERLLKEFPIQYQRILFLHLQGRTRDEIANELETSNRTVRRALNLVSRNLAG